MSARDEILGRVRSALGEGLPIAGPGAGIPRAYRAHSDDGVETFIERLHHYDATTQRVDPGELDTAVARTLRDAGVRRVVAPEGIPDRWLAGAAPMRDSPPLAPHDLDGADGTVTACVLAIAQTGTIVLDGGVGMGRRILSLVPDYLLCVVRAEQVVGSVPQAIAKLEPTRPLTFISGPSATVDIEMVRVGGVHGPRRLEVIVSG